MGSLFLVVARGYSLLSSGDGSSVTGGGQKRVPCAVEVSRVESFVAWMMARGESL